MLHVQLLRGAYETDDEAVGLLFMILCLEMKLHMYRLFVGVKYWVESERDVNETLGDKGKGTRCRQTRVDRAIRTSKK